LQEIGGPVEISRPERWLRALHLRLSAELLDVRNENDLKRAFAELLDDKIYAISVGIDALPKREPV
jgi:hypothetical protein